MKVSTSLALLALLPAFAAAATPASEEAVARPGRALESQCTQDVKLLEVKGVTSFVDLLGPREEGVIYDELPIIIETQNDPGSVKFRLNPNEFSAFFQDETQEFWLEYHNFIDGNPKSCVNMTGVTYDSLPTDMSETYTAKCMHDVPITIVQLWVVDQSLNAVDDALVDTCCRKETDNAFPQPQPNAVQYTFLLHCETTCITPTPAPATTPAATPPPTLAPTVPCVDVPTEESFSNGICQNYGVHAGTTITFGATSVAVVAGTVGVSPGTAITGEYNIYSNEPVAIADVDFRTSFLANYDILFDRALAEGTLIDTELRDASFTPGIYYHGSAINFAGGTMTLDGGGDPSAVFLFQAGTTLVTAIGTKVNLVNGAKAENVIWVLGSAATLGASSIMEGSILAGTSITFNTGAELRGCALAKAAVTFASGGTTGGKAYVDTTSQVSQDPNLPACAPSTPDSSSDCVETISQGVCQNYAVHARTTVTFAAGTTIVDIGGDVGVSPGTSVTGFWNGPTGGPQPAITGTAGAVFAASVLNAYNAAMKVRSDATSLAIEIGSVEGKTYTPGTYRSGSAINFAYGTRVILDAEGDPNAVFLFQAGTTLVTAADTKIELLNGAKAENIMWALGSAATLGANSIVEGSIMTGTAITMGIDSEVHGCALAQSAITFEGAGSIAALDYAEGGTTDVDGLSCAPSEVVPDSTCVESVSHSICGEYAVHARTTVTFDGVTSTINGGHVGVSPGTSITGSYNILGGGQALSGSANGDFANTVLVAYNAAIASKSGTTMLTSLEIGGLTFSPGTYKSGSAINFALGPPVTLDAGGDPNAVFLFQAGTTLVTAADAHFILANGAQAKNVIWALGSAATLGARSVVEGSILAGTAITFGTGSVLRGCALAQSAVTFESNGATEALVYNEGESLDSVGTSCARNTFQPPTDCVESVSYGMCQNYAVHARTTVTFAAGSVNLNGGDVGVSPGTAVTGSYDGGSIITGTDGAEFAASVLVAYNAAMVKRQDEIPLAIEIGSVAGITYTPGTYRSGSAINFAYGTKVILDAQGFSDSVFLFQAGSTLVTAADTKIELINGAKAENIVWALGSAATLGANSIVEGSILAGTAITMGIGSSVHGCVLAQSAITFEGTGSIAALDYTAPDTIADTTADGSNVTSCAASSFQPEPACVESVSHGVCGSFAVHARTTVTFAAGTVTINGGNVGVSPGTSITGSPVITQGQTFAGSSSKTFADSVLLSYSAAMKVRDDAKSLAIEIGSEAGTTYTPGTYRSGSAINFSSNKRVILDAEGDPNAVFLFQAGTTLVTAADTEIELINGAQAKNVIWALGSAATLGARSVVQGSIIAGTAITMGIGSSVHGCALALSAITFEGDATTHALVYDEGEAAVSDGGYCQRNALQSEFPIAEVPSGGMCQDYAVHARTTVTFAAGTVEINAGTVGVSPGTSVTGAWTPAPNTAITGTDGADFAASVLVSYDAAMKVRSDATLLAIEIGSVAGKTYTPGTYRSGSAINFSSGTRVILDAELDADAQFLFQAGTTLVTAADTEIELINGAQAKNVIWALGSAATLGANSIVQGSIIAGTAITMGIGSEVHGCALALSAVTFEGDAVVDKSLYIFDAAISSRQLRG